MAGPSSAAVGPRGTAGASPAPPARVRLKLSAPLRTYADDRSEVAGEGRTVDEALRRFASADARIHAYLYSVAGRFRPTVAIFVNGSDIRNLDGPSTVLNDGDLVTLLPALPGG
jgi:molybdopterin converting factor small subunit